MKNAIAWFELPSYDFTRVISFYSEILRDSFKIDESTGQKFAYFPVENGGVGGVIVPPSDTYRPANPSEGSRIYLSCEDKLDEILARVEPNGGKIIQAKTPFPSLGFIAMIEDTEGNRIGLHGSI